MGGTAYIYSFVNSTYHSTANIEETSQQIGFMFQYKKFQVQGSSQSEHIFGKMKETFKQSTKVVIEYHPPVHSTDQQNQTEWR